MRVYERRRPEGQRLVNKPLWSHQSVTKKTVRLPDGGSLTVLDLCVAGPRLELGTFGL